MDSAVMPLIRRQRCPPSPSRARLQPWQLPAHIGDAGADQRLVADEPEGKADQDRRESREPRPLCRLSDGRSRDSENSLRRHLAADRGTAAAAGLVNSVRRSIVTRSKKNTGDLRLDDRRFGSFSIRLDFGTPRHRSPTSRRQPRLARNTKRLHFGLEPAAHLVDVGL